MRLCSCQPFSPRIGAHQAYDVGLAFTEGNWRVYGKTGTTFASPTPTSFWRPPLPASVFSRRSRPSASGLERNQRHIPRRQPTVAQGASTAMELRDKIET